jgi:hypothetical protein
VPALTLPDSLLHPLPSLHPARLPLLLASAARFLPPVFSTCIASRPLDFVPPARLLPPRALLFIWRRCRLNQGAAAPTGLATASAAVDALSRSATTRTCPIRSTRRSCYARVRFRSAKRPPTAVGIPIGNTTTTAIHWILTPTDEGMPFGYSQISIPGPAH